MCKCCIEESKGPGKSRKTNSYLKRRYQEKTRVALNLNPDDLKHFKKLQKVSISRILFKKIAIMDGKGELPKIKGRICNIPAETENICNALPD